MLEGAELVPPLRVRVPLLSPLLLMLTKILSTLCWLRLQFRKAFVKLVEGVLLNILAGKLTRLVQSCQALENDTAKAVFNKGKLVSPVHCCQALEKLATDAVFMAGKLVSPVQPNQVLISDVADAVFIRGKLVRPEQPQ